MHRALISRISEFFASRRSSASNRTRQSSFRVSHNCLSFDIASSERPTALRPSGVFRQTFSSYLPQITALRPIRLLDFRTMVKDRVRCPLFRGCPRVPQDASMAPSNAHCTVISHHAEFFMKSKSFWEVSRNPSKPSRIDHAAWLGFDVSRLFPSRNGLETSVMAPRNSNRRWPPRPPVSCPALKPARRVSRSAL